ncbi:MAG: hypothetical protein K6E10_10680 [Eubacterium sp.]|nr:hypothetical protein [Eubacterium sp.]
MAEENKGQEVNNASSKDSLDKDLEPVAGKRSPIIRALALILILIYVVLIGVFVYFIVTGSQYILAMLFVLIIYPVILYLLLWIRKVFGS